MSKVGPAYKDNGLYATPLADSVAFTYRLDVF